jgi:ATP-dependent Zn protease
MNNVSLIDVLTSWFPMLLLLGVWFFVMKKRNGWTNMQRSADLLEQQNKLLERIAITLEARRSER